MAPNYSLTLNCLHSKKFVDFFLQNISLVLLLAAMLAPALSVYAQLPIDPNVIHGTAAIDVTGGHMSITNSPHAIINWQEFSIGQGNHVHFQQPDTASQVLNRVIGNDVSQIFGDLSSNGGVWLINPHGVLFGEGAQIDVGGLVASTLDITNIDFLANRYHFNAVDGTGSVINQGEIRTSLGGRVWMTGDQIQNEGLIQSPQGHVVLAAGKSVEFVDSGAPNVVVRVSAPENEVVNLGTMVTANGKIDVHGSIVNQRGIIRANSLATNESGRIDLVASNTLIFAEDSLTQANEGAIQLDATEILHQGNITALGGEIAMHAEKLIYLGGQVDASSPNGTGGEIQLNTGKLEGMASGALRADGEEGGYIRIEGSESIAFSSTLSATGNSQGGQIEVTGDSVILLNADIDASGGTQGGTVHLGGGWQGSGDLPHSREVVIGVGSEVMANGSESGGEIAVWSTQSSEHYGLLQTKDGGRIEFSSKGEIRQTGALQAGPGGTVLFDPKNLIITDNPPDGLIMARKVVSGSEPALLADGDLFGASMALDGDRLAVGAFGDNTGGVGRGAVHLFTGVGQDSSGLTWQNKLASSTGATNMPALADGDFFGASVTLDGDRLAVGADGDDTGGLNRGAVHLFTGVGQDFSGLTWQNKLASSTGATNMPALADGDFFGASVTLDGDRLAVGADGDDTGGSNRGVVHLFTGVGQDFSGLTWQNKLASRIKPIEEIQPGGNSAQEVIRSAPSARASIDPLPDVKVGWLPEQPIKISDIPSSIYKELSISYIESGQPELAILSSKLAVESIRKLNSTNHLADELKIHEQLVSLLLDQGRYIEARFDALRMLKELEYKYYSGTEFPTEKAMRYNPAESKYLTHISSTVNDVIEDLINESQLNVETYQEQTLAYQPSAYDTLGYVKLASNHVTEIMDDSNNQLIPRGVTILPSKGDFGRESGKLIIPQEHSIEKIRARIQEISHIDDIEAELKASNHYLNEIEYRGRVQEDLEELSEDLDEKTLLLFYLVFDEKLTILLYSPEEFLPESIIEIPISRLELNSHISTVRKKLGKPDGYNQASIESQILYNYLITPIKANLDKHKPKTLAIYKTGALRYMPFSALQDGIKYLIEDYALTSYLEGDLAYSLRRPPSARWNIAGFGVSESLNENFSNLPAVEYELKEIGLSPGHKYLNNDFTKDKLDAAISDRTIQVIHIASHFNLDNLSDKSFLLAGNGSLITLNEFSNLQMFRKELVTLSACETALGNLEVADNNGREVEGLAITVFKKTNAHSVLATLWSVSDQSTAIFMEKFYQFRGLEKLSKAEAIRQAQLFFINEGNIFDETGDKRQGTANPSYTDPFYWAPFILMGNWL